MFIFDFADGAFVETDEVWSSVTASYTLAERYRYDDVTDHELWSQVDKFVFVMRFGQYDELVVRVNGPVQYIKFLASYFQPLLHVQSKRRLL